jgi:hypothetical protein
VPTFVKAVRAELNQRDPANTDEWVGNSLAAEILGVNETVLWRILTDRTHIPKEDRIRSQHQGAASYSRADVERFARKYIFVPELQRRTGIKRARDVRPWLEARGVGTAFRLEEQRNFGYLREEVERALRDEEELKIAAE